MQSNEHMNTESESIKIETDVEGSKEAIKHCDPGAYTTVKDEIGLHTKGALENQVKV